MNKKLLSYLAYGLTVVLLILAVIYFTTTASSLPHFLPGYDASMVKAHTKHGIVAVFLALACAAFGWFQGGPKADSDSNPE